MKLKPCPFCGVVPVPDKVGVVMRWRVDHDLKCWFLEPEVIMEAGVKPWNRRVEVKGEK